MLAPLLTVKIIHVCHSRRSGPPWPPWVACHGQPPLLYLCFNRLALRVVVSFLMPSRTPARPFLHCSCESTAVPPSHTLPCHHGRRRACLEP
jgi:hypothetical protein